MANGDCDRECCHKAGDIWPFACLTIFSGTGEEVIRTFFDRGITKGSGHSTARLCQNFYTCSIQSAEVDKIPFTDPQAEML